MLVGGQWTALDCVGFADSFESVRGALMTIIGCAVGVEETGKAVGTTLARDRGSIIFIIG